MQGSSVAEAAARFGYSPGSFNVQLNPSTFNLPQCEAKKASKMLDQKTCVGIQARFQ
jgi:hypothetical protein